MASGRYNVAVGFLALAGFMVMGFVLIYLRDFAPGKEAWAADYAAGAHFETRLAHVHGALFGLYNVALGLALARSTASEGARRAIAWLGVAGLLMPVGILGEVTLGVPPLLVVIGAASITAATAWAGLLLLRPNSLR